MSAYREQLLGEFRRIMAAAGVDIDTTLAEGVNVDCLGPFALTRGGADGLPHVEGLVTFRPEEGVWCQLQTPAATVQVQEGHPGYYVLGVEGPIRGVYADTWIYHTIGEAIAAMIAYRAGVEPEGWERHPASGRRRPYGDASREYVQP
jgi:hypothetical protein